METPFRPPRRSQLRIFAKQSEPLFELGNERKPKLGTALPRITDSTLG